MPEDTVIDAFGGPEPGMFADLEPGRRGEILDAAMGVFAERGYDGGSMRDIAKGVGVSEPALYRHFAGKEALFLALMRAAGGRMRTEGLGLIEGAGPANLRSHLVSAFADRRRAMRRFAPVLRTVLTAVAHNPQFLETYRGEIIEPVRTGLMAKVAELDAAYGIDADEGDRASRVRALMALFVGYFVTSVVFADDSDAAIADAVIRLMGWDGRA
ncbi:MAG: helix-turn-helix domain-containing protein [Coriobacteriia bacterium]|nr:helix-turn-helix domain-containing protein [Coriobacteriia bacterium]